MSHKKQFTIITNGGVLGNYFVDCVDGYYSKWLLKYKHYRKYNDYLEQSVENKDTNLTIEDITKRDIERTKRWYDEVHRARGDYPLWLEDLEKQLDNH